MGKIGLGMSVPVQVRVDAAAKTRILELVDQATASGWTTAGACGVLEIDRRRLWHWQARRSAGTLDDAALAAIRSTACPPKKSPSSSCSTPGTPSISRTANSPIGARR